MSVFKKLKDVLFDIEEEEIPVITKEEKKAPIKKEEVVTTKEVNPIKEVKMPKEEVKPSSSFNFPLDDFDDVKPKSRVRDDYDDVFTPRRSPVMEPKKEERRMDYSKFLKEEPKRKEPSKPFKPTPIISPVYGVLDKNYHKEDITSKRQVNLSDTASLSIDDVRKKAYGTLEDDLENTMFGSKSILFNKETEKEEIKEETLLNDLTDVIELDEAEKEVETENSKDDKDLFDLIDSMYEEDK